MKPAKTNAQHKKSKVKRKDLPSTTVKPREKGISLIMLIKRCDFYYMRNSVWSTGINVRNNFLRYDDPCIRCRMTHGEIQRSKKRDRSTITPLEIEKKRV